MIWKDPRYSHKQSACQQDDLISGTLDHGVGAVGSDLRLCLAAKILIDFKNGRVGPLRCLQEQTYVWFLSKKDIGVFSMFSPLGSFSKKDIRAISHFFKERID